MAESTMSTTKHTKAIRNDPKTFASSPMVTISLGQGARKFYIHRDLLTTFSDYFRASLLSTFIESQTLTVKFADFEVQEDVFEQVVFWLYGSDITDFLIDNEIDSFLDTEMFQLADRLMMPNLKNEIMDAIRKDYDRLNKYASSSQIIEIHGDGLLHSALGRFVVDSLACEFFTWSVDCQNPPVNSHEKELHNHVQILSKIPEIAVTLLKCLGRHRGETWLSPAEGNACIYHEHEDGETC